MSSRCHEIVIAFLAASLPVLADNEPVKKPQATTEVVARFHDGTTIRKAVIEEKLELATKYGKLTVPVGDIRRIEFGLHLSEETAAQIERAVRHLGSDKFAEREAASRELVTLGFKAFPAVQAALGSKDKEVATRAAAVLDKIRAATPEELLKLKDHDVIHTRDSVVGGKISNAVLKAKSPTLGELQFKLGDLLTMHSMARVDAEVALEPAADGKLKWLDTGVVVETDMDVILRRSGQIELADKVEKVPLPPNPGNVIPALPSVTPVNRVHAEGTLLGKIGDKGEPFVVGERFEGKSAADGRLYLAVVPYSAKVKGKYQVDVRAGLELAPGLKRIETRAANVPIVTYPPPNAWVPALPALMPAPRQAPRR